jgi:L-amino acid N-acyltransferase YncA
MPNIRPVGDHDAAPIAGIYNHYIQHSIATFEEQPVAAEVIRQRVESVKKSGLPWLVAEEQGEIVGYAYASPFHPRVGYRHSVEISVYLKNGLQSRGLGAALYRELFSQLNPSSIHMLIACISLPNEPSVALHEKLGMKKTAHFIEVGRKFDRWIDVGYWQMPLSPISSA